MALHSTSRPDIYKAVTDRIVAALEAGVAPWVCPWDRSGGQPHNGASGHVYRGVNVILTTMSGFADARWYTYLQASALGGQVRRGERGTQVGNALALTDHPSKAKGSKITDFVGGLWPIEVKALQGANPISLGSNVIKANEQHAAVRQANPALRLGVTVVGLAKGGLNEETAQYVFDATKAGCVALHECPDTGCVLVVVEDLKDEGDHYQDEVYAALLYRAGTDPAVCCPTELSNFVKPTECPPKEPEDHI